MARRKDTVGLMPVTVGEVRLAWGVLLVLAALTHPARSDPSPTSLMVMLLAFGPGTLVLSTTSGGTRISEGLSRLGSFTAGRLSFLAAIVLAILLGFTFDAFIAFTLTGLCCSLLWSADAVFRTAAWEQRFADGSQGAFRASSPWRSPRGCSAGDQSRGASERRRSWTGGTPATTASGESGTSSTSARPTRTRGGGPASDG